MRARSGPSFRDCRQAARGVRLSEHGREALALVRPRGTIPLFRARSPLAVMLYRAGLERRLLWWSAERFALLDPPTADRRAPAWGRALWLRWLDEGWDLWCFLLPPVLLLAVAAGLTRFPAAYPGALVLSFAAVGFVAVAMAAGLVPGARWLYRVIVAEDERARGDLAVGQVLSRHWAMPLCHLPRPEHALELLDDLFARADVTATVLLFEQGVTTPAARAALRRDPRAGPMAEAPHVLLLARTSDRTLQRPASTSAHAARGVPVIIVALLTLVAAAAALVAGWERAACAADCAERPATYGDAFYWLLNRLSGGDPEGLGAATFQARSIGLAVTLASLVLIGWVVTTLLEQAVGRAQRVGDELVLRHNERQANSPSTADPDPPAAPPMARTIMAVTAGVAAGLLLGTALTRRTSGRRA